MATIAIANLSDALPFGARISGVTFEALRDEAIRDRIKATFVERGVIVFENVEPSGEMQVALSEVFGPLKDHPASNVERVDQEAMPGVIVISGKGKGAMVEIDGQTLVTWQPWHFDHCYNNELNRAGVLRAVVPAREKGLTGFVDGIQIYNDLPPQIRARIEGRNIIYTLDLLYTHMRYANAGFRVLKEIDDDILDIARTMPRAIHPAVWTRTTGEKMMHLAPWMAHGVENDETPAGDALFEDVWGAILKVMKPYYHQWTGTEMVVWDNWRMLHRGMGCDPGQDRIMHRTTITGDYGLGRWEKAGSVGINADVM